MGGAQSKRKGSAFERKVSALILRAVGSDFSKKDCYRTPMSGGHPYAGASDLVISRKLRMLFPFCVECKHRKGWDAHKLFKSSKLFTSFVTQVVYAASKDKFKRRPLLVVRGNHTMIYAAADEAHFNDWHSSVLKSPGFVFPVGEGQWKLVPFDVLLRALSHKIKDVTR